LEQHDAAMVKNKRSTEKKWNPSATEQWHGQNGNNWQQKPTSQP